MKDSIDKIEVLEELKMLWKNSEDVTYKDMEQIQVARYGKIFYKQGTLRNKASKEGWNKDKGVEVLDVEEMVKKELIEKNCDNVEILEKMDSSQEYELLTKSMAVKYAPKFNQIYTSFAKILSEDITSKTSEQVKLMTEKTNAITSQLNALKEFRKEEMDMLGMLKPLEHKKLELEALKLELLISSKANEMLKDKGGY